MALSRWDWESRKDSPDPIPFHAGHASLGSSIHWGLEVSKEKQRFLAGGPWTIRPFQALDTYELRRGSTRPCANRHKLIVDKTAHAHEQPSLQDLDPNAKNVLAQLSKTEEFCRGELGRRTIKSFCFVNVALIYAPQSPHESTMRLLACGNAFNLHCKHSRIACLMDYRSQLIHCDATFVLCRHGKGNEVHKHVHVYAGMGLANAKSNNGKTNIFLNNHGE